MGPVSAFPLVTHTRVFKMNFHLHRKMVESSQLQPRYYVEVIPFICRYGTSFWSYQGSQTSTHCSCSDVTSAICLFGFPSQTLWTVPYLTPLLKDKI